MSRARTAARIAELKAATEDRAATTRTTHTRGAMGTFVSVTSIWTCSSVSLPPMRLPVLEQSLTPRRMRLNNEPE
jgi:hypothetical protein